MEGSEDNFAGAGAGSLLVLAPGVIAAICIIACRRPHRRHHTTSNIWPHWLRDPGAAADAEVDTEAAAAAKQAEASPLLQKPAGGASLEMLLVFPKDDDGPADAVTRALMDVGLVVEQTSLVPRGDAARQRVFGVWAPPALLERKAEQVQLPVRLHVQHGGGTVPYSSSLRPLMERKQAGDFSSLQRQVLVLALAGAHTDQVGGTQLGTTTAIATLRAAVLALRATSRLADSVPLGDEARSAATEAAAAASGVGGKTTSLSAGLELERLRQAGDLVDLVVLHDAAELAALKRGWLGGWLEAQPLRSIRDYYGAQVALYFTWLAFYTRVLALLTVASVPVLLARIGLGADNSLVPFYALLLVLIMSGWHQLWRRTLNGLMREWGPAPEPDATNVERPDFVGETVRHPVSGELVRDEAPWRARLRLVLSLQGTLVMGVSALVVALQLLLLKSRFYFRFGYFGYGLGAGLHGAFISLSNQANHLLAHRLTVWENHRSLESFEGALIIKTTLFVFFNSYSTLFYIAFCKGRWLFEEDACLDGDCVAELEIEGIAIFAAQILIGQTRELLVPYLKRSRIAAGVRQLQTGRPLPVLEGALPGSAGYGTQASASGDAAGESEMAQAQAQLELTEYEGVFDEYLEMVVQFGYVSLFAAALPMASGMACLNNIIELRTDAWKLLTQFRRPMARSSTDISAWRHVLGGISLLAIVTNPALLIFTSKRLPAEMSSADRLWTFIAVEHALLLLKFLVHVLTPTSSREAEIAVLRRERTAHLTVQAFLATKEGPKSAKSWGQTLDLAAKGRAGGLERADEL